MRGGKKVVPGVKIVESKESSGGPAEKQATVVTGNWEEVEGIARGEAAMGAHLHHTFLECSTHLIFSLPSQQHELVVK